MSTWGHHGKGSPRLFDIRNSVLERDQRVIYDSILSTIGHTPLVSLTRAIGECRLRLFAKLEGFNPGGSAKDRPALHILQEAMRTGIIKPWTVLIESSCGNL